MELFKIFGTIDIKDGDAKQKIKDIDTEAESTGRGLGKLGSIAGAMGAAVATAGAAAAAGLAVLGAGVAKTGIQYNAMAEQSQVAWTTLLGTQEEAQDMMKRISDFTKATPFETEEIDMMAKYMHNAGLEGQGLFDELMKVSDVASAFAIPAAEAKEMTRQMSQVRQAGVAYTEDLNILQDRGVPIYKAIAEQLGITTGEVKQMASEGKLSSDIYINAFNGIAKGVEGASKAQSETFLGMISTLNDNFKILSGTVMEPFFNLMKEAMPVIISMVEGLTEAFKNNGWEGVIEKVFPPPVAEFLINAFNTVKEVVGTVFGYIRDNFNSTALTSQTIFPEIKTIIETAFRAVWEVLKTVWSFIKDNVVPIFMSLYSWIQGNMPTIKATISAAFNGIVQVASMVWSFFKDNILPILARLFEFIQSKMPQIQRIVENVFNIIANVVRIAWDIFSNLLLPVLKALWNYIVAPAFSKIQTIIEKVFGAIFTAVDAVVGVFNDTVTAIKKAIDWLTFWDNKKVSKKTIEVEERTTKSSGITGGVPKKNATGTNFFSGGQTLVGERGPELVTLPRGTKIDPANETRNKLNGGNTYNLTVNTNVSNTGQQIIKELRRMEVLYG